MNKVTVDPILTTDKSNGIAFGTVGYISKSCSHSSDVNKIVMFQGFRKNGAEEIIYAWVLLDGTGWNENVEPVQRWRGEAYWLALATEGEERFIALRQW